MPQYPVSIHPCTGNRKYHVYIWALNNHISPCPMANSSFSSFTIFWWWFCMICAITICPSIIKVCPISLKRVANFICKNKQKTQNIKEPQNIIKIIVVVITWFIMYIIVYEMEYKNTWSSKITTHHWHIQTYHVTKSHHVTKNTKWPSHITWSSHQVTTYITWSNIPRDPVTPLDQVTSRDETNYVTESHHVPQTY